jgi:hypothetical protein
MAVSALTASFLAQLRGGIGGDKDILQTWLISTPVEATIVQALVQATFTQVTIPGTTTLIVVIPPVNNVQAITLKGVTGDTGYPLNVNKPTILCVPTGTVQVGLALAAGSNQTMTFVCI